MKPTKQQLFDYILFSIIKRKIELENITWDVFNQGNDFTRSKVIYFPFLVGMPGDETDRNLYFDIFKNIIITEKGVFEKEILEYLQNTENKKYHFSLEVPFGLIINPSFLNKLRTNKLEVLFNIDENYSKIVQKGIFKLCERTENKFLYWNSERLSIDIKKHSVWELYFFYIKEEEVTNIEHIKTCKSIFATTRELYKMHP